MTRKQWEPGQVRPGWTPSWEPTGGPEQLAQAQMTYTFFFILYTFFAVHIAILIIRLSPRATSPGAVTTLARV